MSILLHLYLWPIAAGLLSATALALLGCHLASRDRAMQTLCLSQGAMLGVLLGLGVFGTSQTHSSLHFAPNVFALIVSVVVYLGTEWSGRVKKASPNTLFISVFCVLLSASFLVTALFPTLESHFAQVYFGDLATLCDEDAFFMVGLSLVSLLILACYWRAFTHASFQQALFEGSHPVTGQRTHAILFNVLALVLTCFSIQFLGFLFTISCLFLPTLLVERTGTLGVRKHFVMVCGLAFLSALVGFAVSLMFTHLPTVPVIVLALFMLGALWMGVCRFAPLPGQR